jgi:hypothetical protein
MKDQMNLHPEIRAFFEAPGYKIMESIRLNNQDIASTWFWLKKSDSIELQCIAIQFDNKKEEITYFINNVKYFEEDVLRLIKLKAFL